MNQPVPLPQQIFAMLLLVTHSHNSRNFLPPLPSRPLPLPSPPPSPPLLSVNHNFNLPPSSTTPSIPRTEHLRTSSNGHKQDIFISYPEFSLMLTLLWFTAQMVWESYYEWRICYEIASRVSHRRCQILRRGEWLKTGASPPPLRGHFGSTVIQVMFYHVMKTSLEPVIYTFSVCQLGPRALL